MQIFKYDKVEKKMNQKDIEKWFWNVLPAWTASFIIIRDLLEIY